MYLFSDSYDDIRGYGAYVSNLGSNYYEKSTSGAYDLSPFIPTHLMRIGSSNKDNYSVAYLKHMVIYKNIAIHTASATPISALLAGNPDLR